VLIQEAGAYQSAPRRTLIAAVDDALGTALAAVAAALVAADVVVLLTGVTARYVFDRPFVWSDELASMIFIWLAMLGAVVALRRDEHMRMTALISKAPPAWRSFLDVVALAAAFAFLLLLMPSAIDYAAEEVWVTLPAMKIPNVWRAAALPAGAGLMIVTAVLRLLRLGNRRHVLAALLAVAALIGLALLVQPLFRSLGNLNLVVFFVVGVALLVFAGVPIAFSFGLATVGYLTLTTHMPLTVVVGRMDEGMSHIILLAIPLFVFLGQLIEMTGMAKVMVAFLANLLGHVRGGLSYVLVGAMYLVSGISGSKAADMAAVTPVLFPEMIRRGAKPGDLVALLAATGAQTETIPPSIVLLTIGAVCGVSITALFTGGLLPGVVLGITLCVVVRWRYRHEDLSGVRRVSRSEVAKSFIVAFPALALPFVIRAAVVKGVATATEVSTIGIVYSIIMGLAIYRKFDWRRLMPLLMETAALSGAILLIIGAATGMAWSLTQSGFSRDLAAAMGALPGGKYSFIAVSIVAFMILGSVLEGIPSIVLFGPLLFPIARAIGVNEVHYSMVVILAMGMGLFSPPFGVGYYCATAIGQVNPDEGIGPIVGYMVALFIGVVVVAAIPWISIGFL
jgi:tripartite ATP-independent transporter DctM subunit